MKTSHEREFYALIKSKLEELINKKYKKPYLEITANGHFSNQIKEKISKDRNIIFNFLKETSPDITGYFEVDLSSPLSYLYEYKSVFVVVEIKRGKIKLRDIYQLRRYSELFDAWLAILITLEEIPEEIKRLSSVMEQLLPRTRKTQTVITHFTHQEKLFREWFPQNPF